VQFCSPFDQALAEHGPAAVFLLDPEGLLRFDPTWTRDAWGRAPGPHAHGHTWLLCRDRASGFRFVVLVTSPTLIPEHPRLEVAPFADRAAAERALAEGS
jgi:hypothetical protein